MFFSKLQWVLVVWWFRVHNNDMYMYLWLYITTNLFLFGLFVFEFIFFNLKEYDKFENKQIVYNDIYITNWFEVRATHVFFLMSISESRCYIWGYGVLLLTSQVLCIGHLSGNLYRVVYISARTLDDIKCTTCFGIDVHLLLFLQSFP